MSAPPDPIVIRKIISILEAQQEVLDALNRATITSASCGCCSTNAIAIDELVTAEKLLAELREEFREKDDKLTGL